MKTTFVRVALKHFLVANVQTVLEQFDSRWYLKRFTNGANFMLRCNFENSIANPFWFVQSHVDLETKLKNAFLLVSKCV